MDLFRKIATAAAVSAVVTATLISSSGNASASTVKPSTSSCYVSGGKLWCGNDYNAPLYSDAHYPDRGNGVRLINRLLTTFSWFKCYARGDYHGTGSARNNVWYFTEGDINNLTRWGYVPANYVYTPTDPFPGVPAC